MSLRQHEIAEGGVGVDLSEVFLAAARERAAELGVADRVMFTRADAGSYQPDRAFDVASCIGATWIGGGLVGTLAKLRKAVRDDGLVLVGEPFWSDEPPADAYPALGLTPGQLADLSGTLDRFEEAGLGVVEMVLADGDSWDRYVAAQFWTVERWLHEHPDDEDAPAMRDYLASGRRSHFRYNRRYLGWGVFVLR